MNRRRPSDGTCSLVELEEAARASVSSPPKTEPRARLLEQLGARMLLSIADGVIATDQEGTVTFLNPAAEELTGWPADEVVGRRLAEVFRIFGPDGELESPAARVLREGHAIVLEGQPLLDRKDGRRIPIADSAAPLQLDDGAVGGVVIVFRDASATLREAQRQSLLARTAAEIGCCFELRSTLERVAGLIVAEIAENCVIEIVDRVGNMQRAARARRQTAGEPELVRMGVTDVGGSGAEFRIALRSAGDIVGELVASVPASDRTQYDLDRRTLEAVAERVSSGIENARLYDEARELRLEAEAANRAKDEFLAMLGHELRNPLAPIVTALDLIRRRGAPQFDRELDVIHRQLRHVVQLVDDLLDVSRIVHGRVHLQRQPVDIRAAVLDGVERAQGLVQAREHDLTVDCPAGISILGDGPRLAQAIANLVLNAAKYTPPHGRISVSATKTDDAVVIRVRDSGVGIATSMLTNIFDLFAQEPRSIDRSQGGLGIGLAVVKAIIGGHGGRVHAASDGPGMGTEFVVELPTRTDDMITWDSSSVAVAGASTSVLVVDDNVDAAEVLAASLELEGYVTYRAYDAESASTLASRVMPHAAILDIGLPGIDGYELARRLRCIDGLEHMTLIALTGYGQPSDKRRSLAAGFDAHLVKPATIDAITKLLGPPSQCCLAAPESNVSRSATRARLAHSGIRSSTVPAARNPMRS